MTAALLPAVREALVKKLANLKARCCLQGIVLHELQDDRGLPEYIVCFHAMTKAFSDLDELGRWLDRVEGKRP